MIRKHNLIRRTADFLSLFGAAIAAAAATQQHRSPSARDLEVLGIEPTQFRAIGR